MDVVALTSTTATTAVPLGPEGLLLDLAVRAFTTHSSVLYLALGLMLLVALLRMHPWGDALPDDLVPWVTIAIAAFGAVATALVSGVPIVKAIPAGLTVGVASIGGYESFGKLIRGTLRRLRGQPVTFAGKTVPPPTPPTPPAPPAGGAA